MRLEDAARAVLETAWDDERGYCYPHRGVYPHLWLWDSCFHAIAWAALGDGRGLRELGAVFGAQLDDGFVPHMRYAEPTIERGPLAHASSFTQPPVYAHAAAELSRRGYPVPGEVVAAAAAGLDWLWRHRMGDDGLLYVVHPWESGADDSPRWDDWVGSSNWNRPEWTEADLRWRDAVTHHPSGAAAWSSEFVAAPAAFNAIAAHGAAELAGLTGDSEWEHRAGALADAIDRELWDAVGGLWSDRAVVGGGPSVAVPTLDGALPALVTPDASRARRALAALADAGEFRGELGLRYVPASHSLYNPGGYWRGSSWMQLHYLSGLAANRSGDAGLCAYLRAASRAAALRSGFAEHWNPDTGEGLGARPQTWSALVAAI